MANNKLNKKTIEQIQQLTREKNSIHYIAKTTGTSRPTVRKYQKQMNTKR